jgi:hypothetical protein
MARLLFGSPASLSKMTRNLEARVKARFGTEFVPQTVDLSLTAGGTTKGGVFGRPLSFLFAWIKCRDC